VNQRFNLPRRHEEHEEFLMTKYFQPNENAQPEIFGLDFYDGYLSGFALGVDKIGSCYFHAIAKPWEKSHDSKYDHLFVIVPVDENFFYDMKDCFSEDPNENKCETGSYLFKNREAAVVGNGILEECRNLMRTRGSFMLSKVFGNRHIEVFPIEELLMDDVEKAMTDELECPEDLNEWLVRLGR
jgi:hypothetical protein